MKVLAALLLAVTQVAGAQQVVVVERNVNLRRDPSSNHAPIMLLLPPEELELLDSAKTNNYYPVFRAESLDTGWVWASNVRVADATAAPANAFFTVVPANQINPAWQKPASVVATFQSPVRNLSCGPSGDGGDTATNRRKNRTDIPATYNAVTFTAIAGLRHPATRAPNRLNWPAESLAVIAQFEGVAVQVVGYLVAIKPQGGSGESTNCHMTRASEVDWHVAIVDSAGQGEDEAIVVEPTPRIRVNHPKWTVGRIDDWLDSSEPVRISGWLMFDPSHRNHIGRYRRTLWEIHPVTRIEVWQGGAWVNVDNLP